MATVDDLFADLVTIVRQVQLVAPSRFEARQSWTSWANPTDVPVSALVRIKSGDDPTHYEHLSLLAYYLSINRRKAGPNGHEHK